MEYRDDTLFGSYARGREFHRPTVIHMKDGYWKVLGPGLPFMGVKAPTWESAMNLANEASYGLVRN